MDITNIVKLLNNRTCINSSDEFGPGSKIEITRIWNKNLKLIFYISQKCTKKSCDNTSTDVDIDHLFLIQSPEQTSTCTWHTSIIIITRERHAYE